MIRKHKKRPEILSVSGLFLGGVYMSKYVMLSYRSIYVYPLVLLGFDVAIGFLRNRISIRCHIR